LQHVVCEACIENSCTRLDLRMPAAQDSPATGVTR
jgi:hypothetical protein